MTDIRNSKNWSFETKQLHIGQEQADPVTDARAVPIYASTSYVFHNAQHAADRFSLKDAGNIYGRLTNPTQDIFEQRIAALEGGVAALATASGAAAINYTIGALACSGEHIVASKTIYGGTYNLLAHTLPLSSGEFIRVRENLCCKTDACQEFHGLVVGLLSVSGKKCNLWIHYILDYSLMHEEVERLEDHPHLLSYCIEITPLLCDIDTVDDYLATGRLLQHVNAP